jgi:hypothetical protein
LGRHSTGHGSEAASTKITAAICFPGLPFALLLFRLSMRRHVLFGSMLCSFSTCYCLEGVPNILLGTLHEVKIVKHDRLPEKHVHDVTKHV